MADFQPILARAIAGLPDKSAQARRSVYDRARAALVTQLRSLDPPLSEAEIMRERLSLDEAVSRVEADFEDVEAPPPEPTFAATTAYTHAEAEPAPWSEPEPAQPLDPAPTPDGEATRYGRRADDEPPAFEQPLPPEAQQQIRPRVAPPRDRRIDPGHVRTAIVGTGIALAVAAIAGAAYYVNKVKQTDGTVRRIEAPQQPVQPDGAGKLNDRIGEVPGQAGRGQGAQPVPSQGPEVAVAQRAILYTEVPESPQQPRAVPGRVFWRLDSESAGQGRPVETIVRATIEVPDAGFALDFTIRRNADSAFPASHIIGMRFAPAGDAANDAIREVGVPQFKTDENERGAPLSAISSALGDNLFVAALSNVPVEVERNIDLMQSRPWIDIPVRFASGRRGIITFEKGVSGAQTLADAFNRWQ